jgi:hypothetical protein
MVHFVDDLQSILPCVLRKGIELAADFSATACSMVQKPLKNSDF